MGGSCSKLPDPVQAQPNPNDKIGQNITIPNGCGPAGTVSNYLAGYIPQNGEYIWAGEGGSCHYCSLDAPRAINCSSGCDGSKCCSIIGKTGTYKRQYYNADPTQCCLIQPASQMLENVTCAPQYINDYRTADCDGLMLAYCSGGEDGPALWGTNPSCQRWAINTIEQSPARPIANQAIADYCSSGNNFTTQFCQIWCSTIKNVPTMASACDQPLTTYCKTNPTDPNCACQNPPTNITAIENYMNGNYVCWFNPCKTSVGNWLTNSQKQAQATCPTNIVCTIDAGDVKVEGNGNKIIFENECGIQWLKPNYQPSEDCEVIIEGGTLSEKCQAEGGEEEDHPVPPIVPSVLEKILLALGGAGSSLSLFIICLVVIFALIMFI